MCMFGGGRSGTPSQVYQAPTTPAPVTAKAVELTEEEDLVTDDAAEKKKTGRDTLRRDLSDPLGLGVAAGSSQQTGVNLLL